MLTKQIRQDGTMIGLFCSNESADEHMAHWNEQEQRYEGTVEDLLGLPEQPHQYGPCGEFVTEDKPVSEAYLASLEESDNG